MKPSEFYKSRRPEYFSDSQLIQQAVLTRELLSFELSQISTNQKQDQFETLARRLAEKFITPNLIPQVGPTGGGDGKTDFETHPVSVRISDRWFIPENGWENNEKWAFAVSSKSQWKSKLKSDIKSILSTKREYTKIFFFTSQLISSKKKKDAQDECKNEFSIEIIILDAEWILEKTIDNPNVIDLVVEALNLSAVYKPTLILGSKDIARQKKLELLEENIANPNRYFEVDFQLVEDAISAAILSREIGRTNDEVVGKFERALRLCNKLQNKGQLVRIHYQMAWTYIHYFDDFNNFISAYREVKKLLVTESSVSELELYFNLFNILKGVISSETFDESKSVNIERERKEIDNVIQAHISNISKPSSALIAKTFKIILELWDRMKNQESSDELFSELSDCFLKGKIHLEYPLEMFKRVIEEIGELFADNSSYDSLIDTIAEISVERQSQLASAELYIRRGGQKLQAKLYKDSLVVFGKALLKLAKEESKHGMYLSLLGLSKSYKELGLPWAAYNSLITATSIPIKEWHEKGVFDKRLYKCVKEILLNEIFIGRLPVLLAWNELSHVISSQLNIDEEEGSQYSVGFFDAVLSVRLIDNTKLDAEAYSLLPDLLASKELQLSQHSVLFALGQIQDILSNEDYNISGITNESELNEYFEKVAHQPIKNQLIYDTDLLSADSLKFQSKILGVTFRIEFNKDHELFIFAETILAFLESFLSTSTKNVFPSTEKIIIKLVKKENLSRLNIIEGERSNIYTFELNKNIIKQGSQELWEEILKFISLLFTKHFFINDPKGYLKTLINKEEVHERCALVFDHSKFLTNIMGEKPKIFFDEWIENHDFKKYQKIRSLPFDIKLDKVPNFNENYKKSGSNYSNHNELKVISIIDVQLWDKALWRAFGFFIDKNEKKLGIILNFENHEFGKRIFKDWIKDIGRKDENEIIRMTIIKGVDRNNPNWYRVHITNSMDEKRFTKEKFIISPARFNEMNAKTSENLDNLIHLYNHYKEYFFCPARLFEDGRLEPFVEQSILKKELYIKNAWEIGLNDVERSAIKPNDQPIIPKDVDNAPVIEVLKKLNSK
ncbi:MAG: hypothetical protein JJT77_11860 [Crocinitomicaceae bacterium]|nr:hypothetical protein [Crocinitomicaceae bacterium]